MKSGKTLVYGLGESGRAACRALLDEGGMGVVAADLADSPELRRVVRELGVEGRLGVSPDEALEGVGRVVVSPGVPPSDPVLSAAEKRGLEIVPEVGVALGMLGGGVRVAAVTGTNGKTTVVDMAGAMLREAGLDHAVAGNSWRALSGCVEEARRAGVLLLELSSFQLHYLEGFGFEAAALLNVRPDHLDWHSSFEEYARDKLRIFAGQRPEDLAVVSARDPVGSGAVSSLVAETLVVGEEGTEVRDGWLLLRGERLVETGRLSFTGRHNLENALFAAALAQRLGADRAGIAAALVSYRLKPHRLQVVAERGGVLYVDDSKATNPSSVAAALESFDRPVVLLLGGSEKETGFGELLPVLGRCRAVVCFGKAGPGIHEYLAREAAMDGRLLLVPDLARAVEAARREARAGDVVLLSPGCASFDEFSGYAERGEVFTRLVKEEG
ncbi:UDP-N-acetylmuramoyl-L-alanine--D-glutamate ligase [Rubrobacter naiadicus]|uniref:UDP-N-acetylmuramoyl-L-alanine--D-glutamate ligase n=1 Tax=Rubrobacter naiadicus TaxID=1392641 RepID=UPI002361D3F7|nr:UDP-N-acetylmuramoyl-L-alanine--D-glutamate ligase [Rubrobacter naiadicus]